jgi:hypothetical protein
MRGATIRLNLSAAPAKQMTTIERQFQLVVQLSNRTRERKLKWTMNEDSSVWCDVGQYRLSLDSVARFDHDIDEEVMDISVTIRKNGTPIEKFDDNEIASAATEGLNAYKLLIDTLQMARRQASGADDALDEVIGILGAEQ